MNGMHRDIIQAAVGAFSSVMLFFVLRDSPININPLAGFAISLVWIYMYYHSGVYRKNFVLCLATTMVISGLMCLLFNLATIEQLTGFSYFGSTAVVGIWLGLPSALLLDKFNTVDLMRRHYIRKK